MKRKMREPSLKEKIRKETIREQKSRDRLKAETEDESQRSIRNQFFFLFSWFLFIYRDAFDGLTNFIYYFITNHELSLIVVEG